MLNSCYYPWHHHHNHDHCPFGGNHCKHTCSDCGETYCCKCGKSFGGAYYSPYCYPYWYSSTNVYLGSSGISGGASLSAKSSCAHSHS